MQLKVSTDYAIRIVLYTAMFYEQNRIISSGEISEKLVIPQSIVLKLGAKLKSEGIIDVRPGVIGGFSLKKQPADISLFDIINLFEPTTRINRCLEEDKYCSRLATDNCPVRRSYSQLQQVIEDYLKSVSIQNLLDE